MKITLKTVLITILLILAMVSKGFWERILWATCGMAVSICLIKNRSEKNFNWKHILSGFLAGYFMSLAFLIMIQYSSNKLTHTTNYVVNQETAVILMFDGAPPLYDIRLTVHNYRRNNPIWRTVWLPFYLLWEKISYENVDAVYHHFHSEKIHQKMRKEIGKEYRVYDAYMYYPPYLNEVINKAINDGNGRLILCPVLLTETRSFYQIQDIVGKLKADQYRVKVKLTNPLWDSELVVRSFVEKVNYIVADRNRNGVGILLVGEETKGKQASLQYVKQDRLFREKVKDFLIEEGYNSNKVRLSHFERRSIRDEMEKLMEYGIGQIIILQLNGDGRMYPKWKMKKILNSIDMPTGIDLYYNIGWESNEYIVQELVKRVNLSNYQKWD